MVNKPVIKYLILFSALFFFSCSKEQVQQKEEDYVLQIMTSGKWLVTGYTKGNIDITTDFSAYKFQFQTNRTVDAIKNNAIEQSGSWDPDAAAHTITSNFGNANATLTLLNGTWLLTDATVSTVIATVTVNGETRTLKLKKE